MIQILEQVSSYSNALGFKDQLKKVDLMISPPVQRFDLTGYEMSDTIIGLGYKEAMKHIDILDQLPKKKTEVLIVNDLRRMDPFLINDVEVVGNENTTSRYVRSKLKLKKPRVYTSKKLDEGLDRLYGSNYYEYLDFDLIKVDTAYKLIVNLKERKSDMTLRTGIHYDDDFGIGILLNVTLRNALVSNSRFTIDAVLSENPRGKITYVFDRGYIPALGFQFAFNRFGTRIYSNREAITSLTYQDFSLNVFLISTISNNYSLGAGIKFENTNYLEDFQFLGIGNINNNYIQYYAFIDIDNFNRKYKPLNGFKIKSEIKTIARQVQGTQFIEPSSVAYVKYDQAIKVSKRVGINTTLLAAATIGPDLDLPYNIYFGGLGENYNNFIFPFLGYKYMELIGRNAVMGRVDLYYEPIDNHFFTLKANAGKLEPTFDGFFNSSIILDGYGFSYGYNSPFGPLEFTIITSSNHSDILSYLSLGYWF
jgi:NTE family protein